MKLRTTISIFGLLLAVGAPTLPVNAQNFDPVKAHYSSDQIKLFDRNVYNLQSFKPIKKLTLGQEVLQQMDPASTYHPDLGVPTHPGHPDAVELVDRRTEYTSTYMLPSGTTVFSSSTQPMNYLDNQGRYRHIDYRLGANPVNGQVYRAGNQPIPKNIDAASGRTTFETGVGDFSINNGTNIQYYNGNKLVGSPLTLNCQKHKIGENGLFVQEAFPGMDMQVVMMQNGALKTNYILKNRNAVNAAAEYMIIEDILTLPAGMYFDFDPDQGIHNGNENDWEGNLIIRNQAGEDVFHYLSPMIYDNLYTTEFIQHAAPSFNQESSSIEDAGFSSDAFTYGAYRIQQISPTQFKVSVVIKTSWLLDAARSYPIVIDPITFTGTALNLGAAHCARRVSGTTPVDNPGPTGVGCYSTTTVLPAGYMLAANQPVRVYSGYATRGCAASSTWMKYYGPCGMYPRETGFFYFCNTTLSNVDCGAPAGGHAMDGILSRCMLSAGEDCAAATAPSCSNQTITFNVCYQSRCFTEAAGTCVRTSTTNASNYVQGLGFFRVDVLGEKITSTLTGGGTVCPSTVQNLSLATIFGVPNALNTSNCTDNMGGTYSWSATISGGGSLSATSGTTNTSGIATFTATMPAAAATVTITTTVCNTGCPAPAGTMCDVRSVTYTVGNSIPPIVSDMVVCNGVSAVPAVSNPQAGYTYTWENGVDGAGAVIGTGTSRTIAAVNNSTVSYSVRATAPCTSDWENFTITWGPAAAPSTTGATVCPGGSALLSASCGADCEWYTASSGGASFNSTATYTVNPVTGPVTYYVEYNAGAGCISARTPVTISTNALTASILPASPVSVCSPTTQGLAASVSGNATTTDQTVVTAGPNTIEDASPCTGPDCTGANSGELTISTPANVANPLVAASIQEVCFTTNAAICGKEARFYLTSPAGTIFTLYGGRAKNDKAQTAGTQICFTQTASGTIYAPTMGGGVNIPAGDYIPDGGSLASAFVGEACATGGIWKLHIVDNTAGGCGSGTGTVSNFTMVFQVSANPSFVWSGGPAGGSLTSTTITNPNYTPPAGNYSGNYTVTVTDVAGCTGSAVVNVVCSLLGSELISFYGDIGDNEQGDRSHYLTWKTASENQVDYYVLQRSTDGVNFESLGSVKAIGTANTINEYHYEDKYPLSGDNLYRVAIVDYNGDVNYSNILNLDGRRNLNVYLMPNPASGAIEVAYQAQHASEAEISIYDVRGVLVEKIIREADKGSNKTLVNLENYARGVYTVRIKMDGCELQERFIKQ